MRIVIGCEQGAPAELLRDALTVGSALSERGHSVAYVVNDPAALVAYAGDWIPGEVFQAPVLRTAPDLVMKRPPVDSFADHMATAGFADRQTLTTLASLWQNQLELLRPDVIVGLYSPVLWLIGPTCAPMLAIGNGFALPPALGPSFPRLSPDSTPLASDELMLKYANAALARAGSTAIASLSDVLRQCSPILYGVPAFDPYLPLRRNHSWGLLGRNGGPAVLPPKQRLAAFLDVYCPGIETVVLALAGFDEVGVDVFICGASAGMRRFLEQQPGVRLWNDHFALLDQLGEASAVVHHGVQDVAQRCLALGRPQLLLPWTREQAIFVESIKWLGYSWFKEPTVPIHEMDGTLRGLMRNTALAVSAQHHARQFANTNMPDALQRIVATIEERGKGRPEQQYAAQNRPALSLAASNYRETAQN